jgi:SAM-dependent methyltransferase
MAEICRRKTAESGRVRVVVAHFEDAELEPASFTMGIAAQSWHWVDPERGAAKMAAVIESGGILALMWNAPAVDRSAIRLAIEAVYARHVPEVTQGFFANGNLRRDEVGYQPLIGPGRFGPPSWQQIPWSQRYTSLEYAELLETHSDHQSLPPAQRAGLLADVRATIDDHGGFIDYLYETDLAIFRRA